MGNDGVTRVIPVKTELDMTGQRLGTGACLGILGLIRLEKETGFPSLAPGFALQPPTVVLKGLPHS